MKDRQLSEAERKRLTKYEQKLKDKYANAKGRKRPSKIPARLARTSAFAPRRTHLNTDSNFERLYVVPGHSVIRVTGRELGSQHRDAIYALFRLPHRVQKVPLNDIEKQKPGALPWKNMYITQTTWRELLRAMGRTEHVNNLMTMLETFEDINKVLFVVLEGSDQAAIVDAWKKRDFAALKGNQGQGGFRKMIEAIDWNGVELDSEVEIRYGDWSANMIASAKLVSLNADVQFKLKSDYAKSFWPYIDSMNNHMFVDEGMLAALAGRDLWGESEDKLTRGQFRRETKKAFDDMQRAGGLKTWRVEETGVGRRKSRRYWYQTAYAGQMELAL